MNGSFILPIPFMPSAQPPSHIIFLAMTIALSIAGCDSGSSASPVSSASPATEKKSAKGRQPEKPSQPFELQWDHLEMPLEPGQKFEPWMEPVGIKSLKGKTVRLKGFIHPGGLSQLGNIREFPLIREVGCQFGAGAPAWHIVMVELEGKLRTEYKTEAVTVEGKLEVKPYNGPDGKTWSVYSMRGTKIE